MAMPDTRASRTRAWLSRNGRRMILQLAIDYSARDAIARTACRMQALAATARCFANEIANVTHSKVCEASVDRCWPDFDESAFTNALEAYRRRERRSGVHDHMRKCDAVVFRYVWHRAHGRQADGRY